MFGHVDYDPSCAYSGDVPLELQLEELGRAVAAGKVRYVGLSNETPYGLTRALMAGEQDAAAVILLHGRLAVCGVHWFLWAP